MGKQRDSTDIKPITAQINKKKTATKVNLDIDTKSKKKVPNKCSSLKSESDGGIKRQKKTVNESYEKLEDHRVLKKRMKCEQKICDTNSENDMDIKIQKKTAIRSNKKNDKTEPKKKMKRDKISNTNPDNLDIKEQKKSDDTSYCEVNLESKLRKKASRKPTSISIDMNSHHFTSIKENLHKETNVNKVLMEIEGPSRGCQREEGESFGSSDSGSDSDWEAVQDEEGLEPSNVSSRNLPSNIVITVEKEGVAKKIKRPFDWTEYAQQLWRRFQRRIQLQKHKLHLLLLLSHGRYCSAVCNQPLARSIMLSTIPACLIVDDCDTYSLSHVQELLNWFRQYLPLSIDDKKSEKEDINMVTLITYYARKVCTNLKAYIMIFVTLLRSLGLDVRLIMSLQPIPIKLQNHDTSAESKLSVKESNKDLTKTKNAQSTKCKLKENCDKPQQNIKISNKTTEKHQRSRGQSSVEHQQMIVQKENDGSVSKPSHKRRSSRSSKVSSYAEMNSDEECLSKDKDLSPAKKAKSSSGRTDHDEFDDPSIKIRSANSKRRSEKVEDEAEKICSDYWVEVYDLKESRWICVDVLNATVDRPRDIETFTTKPLHYCLSFDNDCSVKDLTCRYASHWLTQTWRIRVDKDWWIAALGVFKTTNIERDEDENLHLMMQQTEKPLPTTIHECKSNPLYVLARHLLKFEAIYPPTAIPVGYIKKEAIYSRECVKQLHTAQVWIREGRCVKPDELPYKMVKSISRAKRNSDVGQMPVYGIWQTEPYTPPAAKDGVVPKNDYGNVELFKPHMLPPGTVHLPYGGLQRLARKLDIDVAPALVGFELNCGFNTPKFEGVIVCEEFAEALMLAYEEDQAIQRQRAHDKAMQRVVGNWELLTRCLLIRESLKSKYSNNDLPMNEHKKEDEITDKASRSFSIDKKLLGRLYEAKKCGKISSFWTHKRVVYIKKNDDEPQIKVKSGQQLEKLISS